MQLNDIYPVAAVLLMLGCVGYFFLAMLSKPKTSIFQDAQLDALIYTRGSTGGLTKRIDENREIMNLIYTQAPELVSSHPWLAGWLNANDEFFTELAAIYPPKDKKRTVIFSSRPTPATKQKSQTTSKH